MSELKAIRSGEIYNIIEYEDCYRTDDLYYPKSDADNVIAELKQQIEVLQKEKKIIQDLYIGELDDCRILALRAIHNKYKRCLDIAEWCSYKSEVFDQYSRHTDYVPNIEKYRRKRDHYADRSNKLLILAEKFKEKN